MKLRTFIIIHTNPHLNNQWKKLPALLPLISPSSYIPPTILKTYPYKKIENNDGKTQSNKKLSNSGSH